MPLFYIYPQMLTDSSEEATGMDTWESDRGPFRKVLHFRFPFLLGIYRGRQLYRHCSIYDRLHGLGPAFLVQTVQHGRHQMVLVHIFSGLGLHDVCYCGTNLVPVCRYTSAVKAFAYVVIHTRSQPGVVGDLTIDTAELSPFIFRGQEVKPVSVTMVLSTFSVFRP